MIQHPATASIFAKSQQNIVCLTELWKKDCISCSGWLCSAKFCFSKVCCSKAVSPQVDSFLQEIPPSASPCLHIYDLPAVDRHQHPDLLCSRDLLGTGNHQHDFSGVCHHSGSLQPPVSATAWVQHQAVANSLASPLSLLSSEIRNEEVLP